MIFPLQVISGMGSVQILGNNLASHLKMDDLTISLKWSKIGNLHMFLIQVKHVTIQTSRVDPTLYKELNLALEMLHSLYALFLQPVIWTIFETVFLPYVNARIGTGFPLPIISGFMLQNAEIITSNSRITVCSDVTYDGAFDSTQVYAS